MVTAFAISIYSNVARATKPFKDLLHSTYELVYPEKGYRLIGEKVNMLPFWRNRSSPLFSFVYTKANRRAQPSMSLKFVLGNVNLCVRKLIDR